MGQGLRRGLPVQNLMENWDFLQVWRGVGSYWGLQNDRGCPPLQVSPSLRGLLPLD